VSRLPTAEQDLGGGHEGEGTRHRCVADVEGGRAQI
jgi:hypothetical protein